jgi:hydroxymethylpyrimidine pyrophosphatase-like HAD family hydrolase
LDIVDPHINKAEGLLRVAEHFGAERADVIAVGDNANDMDMIRTFRSYAMANGVEALRAAAGAVAESVTDIIKLELQ